MSEWKEYMLRDVSLRITSGGTPKSSEPKYYDGEIPWLNTKEIHFNYIRSTERNITELGLQNSSAKWIPKDSVIVAMYGATAAKVAYSLIDLTTNQACCNIIVDASKADSRYVYYYLQSSYDELSNLACGAAQQNLSIGVISDFPILIPSLDEQKRIAGVLSSLDDKIDLLHRENATLEALAETLFRHYFIENPNPEWKEGKLGELISISSGKGLKRTDFVDDGLYPVLGANGEIGRVDEYLVGEGEKVIYTGRVGTLGNIFRIEGERVWLSDNTLVIKPLKYFNYVYFLLKQANLQDYDVGSTQPLIRQSDVIDIDVVIPNIDSIETFERETAQLLMKIKSNQQQILSLASQRDTLLPRMLSGEVKVC